MHLWCTFTCLCSPCDVSQHIQDTVQTYASSKYRSCISYSYLMSLHAEACNACLIWICLVCLWNCIHSLCVLIQCFILHPIKMTLLCCWSCAEKLTIFCNGNKSLPKKKEKKEKKRLCGRDLDCCMSTRCHFSWGSTTEE